MHRASGSLLNVLWKDSSLISSGHFGCFVLRSNGFLANKALNSYGSKRQYLAKAAQEPFLNGSSSVYVEEMYKSWQQDPNSVHKVTKCPESFWLGMDNILIWISFEIVLGCFFQVSICWSSTRSSLSESTIYKWCDTIVFPITRSNS